MLHPRFYRYNTLMKKATIIVLTIILIVLLIGVLRPRWLSNLTKQVEISSETGAALVEEYDCRRCHLIKGEGAYYAPNLDKIKASEEILYGWLAAPRAMRPNTAMPNFHLSDSEIYAIIAYLQSAP